MLAQTRTYYVPDWEAISAIGTLLAVAVALLWEPLRSRWNRPELKVTWRERDSETVITDSFGSLFTNVRLFVENTGRSAAQRIEITVADVYHRTDAEKRTLISNFLPTALFWTHTQSPRWEYLAPRSSRLCDLGRYTHTRFSSVQIPHEFKFRTEIEPESGYNTIGPGSYFVRIVATAINCKKADSVLLCVNVGPHLVDGNEEMFSIFDPSNEISAKVNTRQMRLK